MVTYEKRGQEERHKRKMKKSTRKTVTDQDRLSVKVREQ